MSSASALQVDAVSERFAAAVAAPGSVYDGAVPIAYDVLESALAAAIDTYLRQLVTQVDAEDLYAVGLYTGGELSYLTPTANTRSGLVRSPNALWSPPDWALHLHLAESFQPVEDALAAGWTEDFATFDIDEARVRATVHHLLRSARQRHFGDTGIVMGLFMGGMAHPWVEASVEAINPPEVAQTFGLGLKPRTVPNDQE